MPYGITQCYLPPGWGDIPAFTPAKAGTRFSDPGGMQGWVDPGGWLEMVYPLNGHPTWTNRARCWLTSLMRPTTLTTTPSRHPVQYKTLICCVWLTDEKPDVSYSDIGGMDIQKQEVREAVELPLTHFELYKQIGIDPPRGVLMFGPPGCGKTMLAKAVAHHTTGRLSVIIHCSLH